MAGTIQNAGRGFWQPHLADDDSAIAVQVSEQQVNEQIEAPCSRCGTAFLEGARFCHTCGTVRIDEYPRPRSVKWQELQPTDLFRGLELSTGPLMAFLVGILCISAAAFAGIFITVQTGADWESLQYWRIDWLLAATAAFAAGILLKKR